MTAPNVSASLAVVGTGYVGLVTGTCLASRGHHVACHDIDGDRVARLQAGEVPIYEPGLEALIADATQAGRLRFTTELADALAGARFVFLAVGTPPLPDGAADLRMLDAAADAVAKHAARDTVLVIRSTVPPGTGDALQARLAKAGRRDMPVVNAPEFLAEGTAVHDFLEPDRLVFGGPDDAARQVAGLWDGIRPEAPRVRVTRPTAELAKYAANTFLAARVSLINEMANLADAVGADVRGLARIIGLDSRIGPKFLRAGIGYGGSCFPKDVQALAAVAQEAGVDVPVAQAVEATNRAQWRRVLERARNLAGGDLAGKKVAVWGIAFKPGTDDTREAPGLRLAAALADAGATVVMHDPTARLPPDLADAGITQAADPVAAAEGANLLIHVTEWPDYAETDWARLADRMKGRDVIDARNALPWPDMAAAGLRVHGIGARQAEEVVA